MSTLLFSAAAFVLISLSFIIQEFIPSIGVFYQAHLLIVPVVFFAAAITLPFPLMLAAAFFTGFIWDARHQFHAPIQDLSDPIQASGGGVDLIFGYSILLFGIMGAFMQGIRPLFRRGRWELPVLMIGLATLMWLLLELFLINFQAGDFLFTKKVFVKASVTSTLSMMVAPFIFILFYRVAALCGYQIRYDGLRNRTYGYR